MMHPFFALTLQPHRIAMAAKKPPASRAEKLAAALKSNLARRKASQAPKPKK